mmetsp:Transcript_8786/g.18373  ORF Transcript_8786/g.18373 Transcript_8786/m.18373 type:complete len:107 (-) Transcript_8786:294-614(-)
MPLPFENYHGAIFAADAADLVTSTHARCGHKTMVVLCCTVLCCCTSKLGDFDFSASKIRCTHALPRLAVLALPHLIVSNKGEKRTIAFGPERGHRNKGPKRLLQRV